MAKKRLINLEVKGLATFFSNDFNWPETVIANVIPNYLRE